MALKHVAFKHVAQSVSTGLESLNPFNDVGWYKRRITGLWITDHNLLLFIDLLLIN